MTARPRAPPERFARETTDTKPEYARARIENTDDPNYLAAMLTQEAARDDPRQQRIGWINQRLAEVRDVE